MIYGSTQGIGLATAIILADLGATCILIARNESALKQAVNELSAEYGQRHSYKVADFSDAESVSQAITAIVAEKNIEILVNNSGGPNQDQLQPLLPMISKLHLASTSFVTIF